MKQRTSSNIACLPRLGTCRAAAWIRRLWLILAVAGLVLAPVALSTHAVAMTEAAAMAAMSDCSHSPPISDCQANCPPSMACPADSGPASLLIGAAYDAVGPAGIGLPVDEETPKALDRKPIFPPPRD